jgi:hypothetical protein
VANHFPYWIQANGILPRVTILPIGADLRLVSLLSAIVALLSAIALQEIPGIAGRTVWETAQAALPLWCLFDFVGVIESLAVIGSRIGHVCPRNLVLEFPPAHRAAVALGGPDQQSKTQQTERNTCNIMKSDRLNP